MSAKFGAVVLAVLLPSGGCASETRNPGATTVSFPAESDHHLRTPTEIRADEIEIVLPRIYRGACSVVCDPDAQERRITSTQIELVDPAGLGIPPLTLQVVELRLLAKQRLKAIFDDDAALRNRQRVKVSARGHVRLRTPDGLAAGSALSIRNADLELTP
ncbi:MAG: hypothetical protein U1E76_08495 [Planctomycetota bacterium]